MIRLKVLQKNQIISRIITCIYTAARVIVNIHETRVSWYIWRFSWLTAIFSTERTLYPLQYSLSEPDLLANRLTQKTSWPWYNHTCVHVLMSTISLSAKMLMKIFCCMQNCQATFLSQWNDQFIYKTLLVCAPIMSQ